MKGNVQNIKKKIIKTEMVTQKLGANVTDVRIVVYETLLREISRGMIKKYPGLQSGCT